MKSMQVTLLFSLFLAMFFTFSLQARELKSGYEFGSTHPWTSSSPSKQNHPFQGQFFRIEFVVFFR